MRNANFRKAKNVFLEKRVAKKLSYSIEWIIYCTAHEKNLFLSTLGADWGLRWKIIIMKKLAQQVIIASFFLQYCQFFSFIPKSWDRYCRPSKYIHHAAATATAVIIIIINIIFFTLYNTVDIIRKYIA